MGGDVNLFRYVGNDPIDWIDPIGLIKFRKLTAGFLSMVDGFVMVGTAFGVTVGSYALLQNPLLTSVLGTMMLPVAVVGVYDIHHGFHIMKDAIEDKKQCE
jgi:hypothetical protein